MPITKNMAAFYNSLVTFYNSLVKINPLLAIQKARIALQWGPQKEWGRGWQKGGGRGEVTEPLCRERAAWLPCTGKGPT